MQRHPEYTRKRLKLLADRMLAQVYPERVEVQRLAMAGPVPRIPASEAEGLTYRPVSRGEQLGPLWSTFWFRATTQVPTEWAGSRVDLLWNSASEATLWLGDRSVQGLNGPSGEGSDGRPDATLVREAQGGESVTFRVEVACNTLFGRGRAHYQSISPFVLDQCDIARFDPAAWDLYFDFLVLQSLEAEVEKGLDPSWAGELLFELNRVANLYHEHDRATWEAARAILQPLLQRRNGTSGHQLSAIGHAHIDTAWLWPIGETWRKCERTFSSQTTYMEDYPEYRFACSQACQHHAMQERNPDLFERMRQAAARGQFVPVGGTWVEPDCNVPSGESLARQFLIGQRYFEQTYGARCLEFWNPDVFGYNGQLPQLMREAGISRFLTQKLSWNRFTKPLYHTFRWEGIDGSQVLAHFPPLDTYNATAEVSELRANVRNYKDHDRSRYSFMLFGYGDGGGGPTRRMIEILRRTEDLQGLPRTRMSTSAEFFTLLERDVLELPIVVGELYFEYHRGTYTTQASTKQQNRRNEWLLHNIEFLSALAWRVRGEAYPQQALEALWRRLLVNQFHDILPGSSITEVYQDTLRDHEVIRSEGEALLREALGPEVEAPYNTLGVPRQEVCESPRGALIWVDVPSYGVGRILETDETVAVEVLASGGFVFENRHLRVEIGAGGTLESLVHKATGRESLGGSANVLELYDDHPTAWDAWDVDPFHLETVRPCPAAAAGTLVSSGPLRAEVLFSREVGQGSRLQQWVRLDAGARRLEFHTEVDWHESHRLLKVAFPVSVRSMTATYEMQFGCVERPTHFNTLQDLARFEVPGHRFSDLSEHGFGVALLSDSKYGYSTHGNVLRMTLLRAPKSPDPEADMGHHVFAYAVLPHADGWQAGGVVAEGLKFNQPVLWGRAAEPQSWFLVDDPNLVLDTVKKAEDADALVLRLYECHGARGTAKLECAVPVTAAWRCNLLEDEGEPLTVCDGDIEIDYEPYKIISIKVV